ncbi:hypothetical protein VA7868_01503 [Vibrio aerogenes CECT 7868]|uniref:Uncharacterized protein n=1 Tax=Vibrio aerogenes CECT 7868 TaxID=1216006 RepID=A0A1M5Y539_9VIBR|nr:hypothetical protein [Vibrio aerogenes]SHI07167.1 hypothetical protein VA7868_01503 [Vibrio aerogenes CECT 7868]
MKKYLLLILCTGLLWVYYFFPAPPQPGTKLPESLLNLNKQMLVQAENTSLTFGDYWINDLRNKKSLTNNERQIIKLANHANVRQIIFDFRDPIRFSYYPDYYYFLTDKFYIYAADDYTEETQVPSIKQAIEQLQDKSIYHFCEPADHPHWFLCVRQD